MSLRKDIYASVVFLTRFPAPGWPEAAERPLAKCMWAFPIAGVLVATVGGAIFVLCNLIELPVFVAALLSIIAMVIATGGLHEDGLSDLADGIWGGTHPEHRLTIMSDSRIGAYGTIALILTIGARTASIAAINDPGLVLGALVATSASSRGMIPLIMAFTHPAKGDGLGASAGTPPASVWGVALLLAVLICLLAAPTAWLSCLIAMLLGAAFIGWFAQRKLGGYTGDVLGASQQLAELLGLAVIAGAITVSSAAAAL
ncbi:MAG: adenosylcobinamide-GDP ribazoletransferase [Pseudomonadota bacterium]|nr:adenosylcobinamide-GDP ribazoletransferase [Pseudomonadota bacterium]